MAYDFDRIIDRCDTDSIKWNCYEKDVLPLWVADMDFESPREVVEALIARARHGVFGYTCEPEELGKVLVKRMEDLYKWKIQTQSVVFLGGVVAGFNLACHALAQPGAELMLFPPIYPPMLSAAHHAGLSMQPVQLLESPGGRYELDWEAIHRQITSNTRVMLLCNPHNPVGKVFDRSDLQRLAGICVENDLWIVSDEIHCDLVFPGSRHTPIASLGPEISDRTITLMAPSKTFNIPGLGCSFAIVENAGLRERLTSASQGLMPHVNLMGYTGALAAYQYGQPWLEEVVTYLEGNYQFLRKFIRQEMPAIKVADLQATYLAWLDCRTLNLQPNPSQFFLDNARLGLNDGASFGAGGEGFMRLNFACPRPILVEALERMKKALDNR